MKLFLSHSNKDKRIAEQVCLALRNLGHDVFFDRDSLLLGDEFDQKIRSEILKCDRFVFLLSKNSIREGTYALTELKFAQQRWPHPKKRVLTVAIDDTTMDESPAYLTAANFLRPVGNISAEVAGFVAQLDEVEQSLRRTRYSALAAVLTIALIVGATAWYLSTRSTKTAFEITKENLTQRLPQRPGTRAKTYPQFGLGFLYPRAWQLEDAASAYGVPDIDIIQRYTDQKAAIGVELRLIPVQPNYVQDFAAEVRNQSDVYRRIDPNLIVEDVTIDGMPAKRFRYTQSTGVRTGAIQVTWVRLAPEVKLQIIAFTYTDEPDRNEFDREVDRIIDSIAVDQRFLNRIRDRQQQASRN